MVVFSDDCLLADGEPPLPEPKSTDDNEVFSLGFLATTVVEPPTPPEIIELSLDDLFGLMTSSISDVCLLKSFNCCCWLLLLLLFVLRCLATGCCCWLLDCCFELVLLFDVNEADDDVDEDDDDVDDEEDSELDDAFRFFDDDDEAAVVSMPDFVVSPLVLAERLLICCCWKLLWWLGVFSDVSINSLFTFTSPTDDWFV